MFNLVKSIESIWRHRIVYPILRLIIRNTQIDKPIDLLSINKLLILRYDRIGDMIITTPIFRNLKKMNPELKIGVFASRTNAEIIKYNPYIYKTNILSDNWWQLWKEMRMIRKEKYDVVLNFVFKKMTMGGILINLIAPQGIKIGQGENKYRFYFNRLLSFRRDSRLMVELLASFVNEAVGVDMQLSECNYEIITDEKTRINVREFLAKYKLKSRQTQLSDGLPYIIFNLSASDKWTKLSIHQAEALGSILGAKKSFRTVIVCAPDDYEMSKASERICMNNSCLVYPENGNATLLQIAALVESANCVITPDTSIVHFASAAETPLLAFYSSAKEKKEWLPFHVKNKIIWSDNNLATSSIPVDTMIEAVNCFLSDLKI